MWEDSNIVVGMDLKLQGYYVLINVGRFVLLKNQIFLLKTFKRLCEKTDKYKLILVGTGELEGQYREYVAQNKLENSVIFLGQRNDVNCILQAADCFCLTSEFEGLPIRFGCLKI